MKATDGDRPAVVLEGVAKRFGEVTALDGLSLEIPRGTVYGLLGPNGAGKTTTLRALLGLLRPDAGRLRVLGRDPRAEPCEVRRRVGVLLESDGLYDRLSARENLAYHARLHRMDAAARRRRIDELLEVAGLAGRQRERVAAWSKGMRQRLAVARALLHAPQLLLLDEPFSGLDPQAAVELRDRIAAMAREGLTILLTTHDLAHVEKVCARVAVLVRGRAVAEGTPGELARGGGAAEVLVTGTGLDEALLAGLVQDGVATAARLVDGHARVACAPGRRADLVTELVRRGVRPLEVREAKATLEDEFLAIVRGEAG